MFFRLYLFVRLMGDDSFSLCDYNSQNFQRSKGMKQYRIFLAITALVLASFACQALTGGGNNNIPNSENSGRQQSTVQPTEPSTDSTSNSSINTNFPMTSDAFNEMELGEDSILYYTKLSADDTLKFFRDTYAAKGYTERKILTVVSNGTFSIVFDGDPSGKAVVIQSVDLGDGSRTIAIRLESV